MPEARLQRTRDAYPLTDAERAAIIQEAAKMPRLSNERVGQIMREMWERERAHTVSHEDID